MRHSSVRPRIPLTGGILTVMLLWGCANDSAEEPASSPVGDTPATADAAASMPADACMVLPASDVQGVLGEPVSDSLELRMPESEGPVTLSVCKYATARNPAAARLILRHNRPGETAATTGQRVLQTLAESGTEAQEVSGLGEIAFWSSNELHVFQGQEWYIVIPAPSAGLEQAQSLADLALSRL